MRPGRLAPYVPAAQSPAPQVDDRSIAAGTTVRFILLTVLIVVAAGSMAQDVVAARMRSWGCALAAGADPNAGTMAMIEAMQRQSEALKDCSDRYEPPTPWWIPPCVIAVLMVAAVVVFAILIRPRSGRRDIPIERLHGYADLTPVLAELVSTAEIGRSVRFVVDPTALSAGAVVTGRTRRPTVRLHGGLLTRMVEEPQRFRAVVLHELAHIYNRDATPTYATVALWRAFAGAVLVPYLVWAVWTLPGFGTDKWLDDIPYAVRNLAMTAVLAVLVYLVRADVLRTREIYADRTAVRWGADPRGWVIPEPRQLPNPLRRIAERTIELFLTHPRWGLRRRALDDPSVLFDISGLPILSMGVAASLISGRLSELLTYLMVPFTLKADLSAMAAAALMTGAVGFTVWRRAIFGVITATRPATGLRLGIWFGIGFALGELVLNRVTVSDWLPDYPVALLLPIPIGMFYGWWATRCTELWVTAWPGRSDRIPFWINIIGGFLVLTGIFAWWGDNALVFSTWAFQADTATLISQKIAVADGWPLHLAIIVLILNAGVSNSPFTAVALTAVWLTPLLLWAVAAGGLAPWRLRFVRAAEVVTPPHTRPLPSLRDILAAAAAGAITVWGTAVLVAMVVHTLWPPPTQAPGWAPLIFVLPYLLPAAAGSIVAAATAARGRRDSLLGTLIAVQLGLLVGWIGIGTLMSTDGCIAPLTTTMRGCRWNPGSAILFLTEWMPLVLAGGVLAAAVVSAAAPLLRYPKRSRVRRPMRTLTARRIVAATLCVIAIGAATAMAWGQVRSDNSDPHAFETLAAQQEVASPTSKFVLGNQVVAWFHYSDNMTYRIDNDIFTFINILTANNGSLDGTISQQIGSRCLDLADIVPEARRYFRISDPQSERLWEAVIDGIDHGSRDCAAAVATVALPPDQTTAQQDAYGSARLDAAVTEFRAADDADAALLQRIRDLGGPALPH
ncbi:M48 family metalloprotease [Nocardia sp. NEAU-G5]|uniref:M48 family metalloprotease n=1 Tax=Nocardia albiluteola TaxID=2842303 RepID=A0ABS6B4P8_9NOCA|nr:M48 family metalloprotease [Nocardia albiluteola]MBU3065229.1 M48 family metalloprotease [Nocardia albiluteola]